MKAYDQLNDRFDRKVRETKAKTQAIEGKVRDLEAETQAIGDQVVKLHRQIDTLATQQVELDFIQKIVQAKQCDAERKWLSLTCQAIQEPLLLGQGQSWYRKHKTWRTSDR